MATKITGMTAVTAANLDDTTLFEAVDKLGATVKATLAQIRTQLTTGVAALALGAAGLAFALNGTAKTGADQAAGLLTIQANLSTGAGTPGGIAFTGGQILGSSSTVQTAATIATLRMGTTTAFSEFVFGQATARIVGGSTNGLALRNSGNTRDNFRVFDSGVLCILNDGTHTGGIAVSAGSGELLVGTMFGGINATDNAWLMPLVIGSGLTTTGQKAGIAYHNQTQYYSALEVSNVAAGFGTLSLMKSGGATTGAVSIVSGVAAPATAGAAAAGAPLTLYSSGISIEVTTNVPTHTRPKGSICINSGGSTGITRMYINTDGAGTWTPFTTAA